MPFETNWESGSHFDRFNFPGYINEAIGYDNAGLITSYRTVNGVETTFGFDENNRLESLRYHDATGSEVTRYTFAYDYDDNIITRNDDYYSYDRLGRLQSAMIVGAAGQSEYDLGPDAYRFGAASVDVLGEEPVTISGGALTVTHDAGSVAVEAGYAYRIKRVVFDDAVFDGNIVTPDRLRVYTSMYNTDVSYLLAEAAQIFVDEAGQRITVEFPSPIFTRFVKLHVTIHEMDFDGNTIVGASVLSIDPASTTVTALSGGRNELYGYEPDGDRSNLSILAAAPTSTPYDYYPDSDLVRPRRRLLGN